MGIETLVANLHGLKDYEYNLGRILLIGLSATVVGSLLIGGFEVLFFSRALSKIPFGVSLIIKAAFYLVSIFFFTSFATQISYSYIVDKPLFHHEVLSRLSVYLRSPKLWAVTLYWGVMIMAAVFILQVSEKFGRGVMLNFILGKYHRPKVEDRIFMFLDLTSSTAYAEKLGHIKYSKLLQDCFYDLTEAASSCGAQIYQYVGDEVVLTWSKQQGLKNGNCIKMFFKFAETLNRKGEHYKKEFGMIPEFKTGIHLGEVTVVEVGELKKELAYHGDALNTTARIRSSCNEFNKKLLVSADLLSLLADIDRSYKVESIGVCKLKGKKNVIALFSVE
ncbi:MAG: adenylate/guanylate cyclase domain-containing protein [Ignavibacteriae bacterium]|nr:adenylate/guanylate cyclase domain-containing protein [Ignavibacteriota bacterium]NOG99471.1 adenylate/guanylate cyclase domain-containing protein [Ignavibacteriota bacterium]